MPKATSRREEQIERVVLRIGAWFLGPFIGPGLDRERMERLGEELGDITARLGMRLFEQQLFSELFAHAKRLGQTRKWRQRGFYLGGILWGYVAARGGLKPYDVYCIARRGMKEEGSL